VSDRSPSPFALSEVEVRAPNAALAARPSATPRTNGGTGAAKPEGGFADRGELFSDSATRLAGLAGLLLGWRPDEFWRATPGELEAVLAAFAGPRGIGDTPPDASTIAALKEQFPDG